MASLLQAPPHTFIGKMTAAEKAADIYQLAALTLKASITYRRINDRCRKLAMARFDATFDLAISVGDFALAAGQGGPRAEERLRRSQILATRTIVRAERLARWLCLAARVASLFGGAQHRLERLYASR